MLCASSLVNVSLADARLLNLIPRCLPIERMTLGPVFDKVGVDYAGPVLVKYGHVCKPTAVKAYICVFVSLTVKAVHLDPLTLSSLV